MSDSSNNQEKQRGPTRRAGIGQKLVLLMWKNLLLRKRHWVLTLFEVLLPTLLFSLIVSIRVLPDSAFQPTEIDTNTTFKFIDEDNIRSHFCSKYYGFWNNANSTIPLVEPNTCVVIPEDFTELLPALGELPGLPNVTIFRKLLYGPPGNWTEDAATYLAKQMGTKIPVPLNPAAPPIDA
ncbi:unnamed protein product, partial [Meganyctiphanes norvegica]